MTVWNAAFSEETQTVLAGSTGSTQLDITEQNLCRTAMDCNSGQWILRGSGTLHFRQMY